MKISLCIVARNEALFLRDCIESARPIVDEVVVVDTGSTDGTPELASQAGARLIRADWPGDLGRAHNLPIEHARGEWILSLDGDEVLDPTRRHRLRELTGSDSADGYRLPIRNYSYEPLPKWRPADPTHALTRGALGYIPTRPVRLFRRREVYRFSGLLHQAMAPSIQRHEGRIGEADVPIHHYGALRSDRSKSAFYQALARRQVAAEPQNPRAWIELGVVLYPNDLDAALHAFRRARSLGLRPTAAFFIGWALLARKRPAAAIPLLHRAIRGNPLDELPDYDRSDAWELLGRAYEMLADPRKAEGAYRRAIGARSHSPVALNNLAGLLAGRGATSEAGRVLDRLLVHYRGLDMVWATLGALRWQQRDPGGARRAFEVALDINPANVPARVNLAVAQAPVGCPRKASRARAAAPELQECRATSGSVSAENGLRATVGRVGPLSRARQPGTIVSIAWRVDNHVAAFLLESVRVFRHRPQLVLCGDAPTQAVQDMLRRLGPAAVEVRALKSGESLRNALKDARPAYVIDHWSDPDLFPRPLRIGSERWIAVGYLPLPMPDGYDAYVVRSAFHERLQSHLSPHRMCRVPGGVNLRRFRTPGRGPGQPVTIAMLSRLDPGRFPRRLLAFLPSLSDLHAKVVIGGIGPRRYEIEPELVQDGMSGAVRFVGPISPDRVPDFLDRTDIGLYLTETHQEVCPLPILEMLAAGLPVVAETKGCLPELITSGENGFLAAGEQEIAARLRCLLRRPQLRRRMGTAARRTAQGYAIGQFRSSLRSLLGPRPEGMARRR